MIRSESIMRLLVVLALSVLAACTSKPEGTYYADFSSSGDPNVALAASLMKLSLSFAGDDVTMQIQALGNSETVEIGAEYKGGTVVLTKPDDPKKEQMVLKIEDDATLRCEQCPAGMPSLWKKQQ